MLFQKFEMEDGIYFCLDSLCQRLLVENLKLSSKTQLPIFFIADTFNRVVFSSQGYTIGLGEQLKNTFNRL